MGEKEMLRGREMEREERDGEKGIRRLRDVEKEGEM